MQGDDAELESGSGDPSGGRVPVVAGSWLGTEMTRRRRVQASLGRARRW